MNDSQYENIKDLYLSSFQRIATIVTLINSGGIIAIATLIAGNKPSKFYYLYKIVCISFYPLNGALLAFSLALLGCFLVLFIDFWYIGKAFDLIKEAIRSGSTYQPNLKREKIIKCQWIIGIALIICMIIGFVLALTCVMRAANYYG